MHLLGTIFTGRLIFGSIGSISWKRTVYTNLPQQWNHWQVKSIKLDHEHPSFIDACRLRRAACLVLIKQKSYCSTNCWIRSPDIRTHRPVRVAKLTLVHCWKHLQWTHGASEVDHGAVEESGLDWWITFSVTSCGWLSAGALITWGSDGTRAILVLGGGPIQY